MSGYVPGVYPSDFSNSEKKIEANKTISRAFAEQGLNIAHPESASILVLDTDNFLTTKTLIDDHCKNIRRIIIVESEPDTYDAILKKLPKFESDAQLTYGYCPKIDPIHADVFDFLDCNSDHIDFMWLDLMNGHIKSNFNRVKAKLAMLKCLAVTFAVRARTERSVEHRVSFLKQCVGKHLPHITVNKRHRSSHTASKRTRRAARLTPRKIARRTGWRAKRPVLGQQMQLVSFGRRAGRMIE